MGTFQLYRDARQEYRWRLRARNSKIIADCGEGYASRSNVARALKSVKTNASDSPIDDQSAG